MNSNQRVTGSRGATAVKQLLRSALMVEVEKFETAITGQGA